MLIVLSPAKTLDFETPPHIADASEPAMLTDSERLVAQLRRMRPARLGDLMSISENLAALNAQRFKDWSPPFTAQNAKQAVLAFAGDVYDGLDARSLDPDQLAWAQDRLRILSGLYGVLRPLDLMQAYRLEMGTRLKTRRGPNLYRFWGARIAAQLNLVLAGDATPTLVNLASEEYFKSVDLKVLKARVIQPVFEEARPNPDRPWAVISFMAKKARGAMARYAIENRLTHAQALHDFNVDGYRFAPAASTADRWVYRRA